MRLRKVVLLAAVPVAAALVGIAFRIGSAPQAAHPPPRPPRFRHVILIVFENRRAVQVLDNPAAVTFRGLAERYATLERYDAVAHPSLPDYLALISGSTYGLRSDCTRCVIRGRSLADTLSARSLTWKAYVERMPPALARVRQRAVKARIPFLYFRDVLASSRRMRSIVPLAAFERDFRTRRLPSFSLVIPELCHDMHSCSVRSGDRWLRGFLRPLLRRNALRRSAVFVVFDEARRRDARGGGGRVAAIVAGPLVRRDSVSEAPLTHYSLLRTIEDAWNLPRLGRSASARAITGIWRRLPAHVHA
jgi:phosphatidylinositol-3-phosphatase